MALGKITISKQSMQKGKGKIFIEIEDGVSGLTIARGHMSMVEYADCITGLGHCDIDLEFVPNSYTTERYGKKRESMCVSLDEDESWGLSPTESDLESAYAPLLVDGWELWDDGRSTQQNTPGKHVVILCRYV